MANRKSKVEDFQKESTTTEEIENAASADTKELRVEQTQEAVKTGIPEYADKALKCFPNEEKLYVNKFGGVFTVNTKHSETDGAILYQNPYFNKQ